MPLLASLLGSAFTSVVTFLAAWVGKKVAVAAALGAFLATGWVALAVALHGLFTAISYAMPGWMAGPLGVVAWLLPDNFSTCLTAIFTAYFTRWVWDAQREWAKAVAAV
jgi:hypothetical protein